MFVNCPGTFEVRKINKRLWIVRYEDGVPVYTPPDFVKIHSRQPMIDLAAAFTKRLRYDISAVVEFQSKYSIRK